MLLLLRLRGLCCVRVLRLQVREHRGAAAETRRGGTAAKHSDDRCCTRRARNEEQGLRNSRAQL